MKLRIPTEARRSNSTGRKCRAEYADDMAHYLPDGTEAQADFHSLYDDNFVYRIGERIVPDTWNEDRWQECGGGIHFFITRFEAEEFEL